MIFLVGLVAFVGGSLLGFYMREVRNTLAFIGERVASLKTSQDKKEQQEKKMTFAEPIKYDELTDEEKIDLLNM